MKIQEVKILNEISLFSVRWNIGNYVVDPISVPYFNAWRHFVEIILRKSTYNSQMMLTSLLVFVESMLRENLQLSLLSRRRRDSHFQSKAIRGTHLYRVRYASEGSNQLREVRNPLRTVHLPHLQSFRWWRQVPVSLRFVRHLPSRREGSLLPLWGVQYVLTGAAQDGGPSMRGEREPLKLRCVPRGHSSQSDSLPYSHLRSPSAPDVLRAALGVRLLCLSDLPTINARHEATLELSG